jgi:hypothetical protein
MLVRHFGRILILSLLVPSCTQTIREEEDTATIGAQPTNPTSGPSNSGDASTGSTPGSTTMSSDESSSGTDGESSSSTGPGSGALCGNGIIEGQEECDCGEGNVCSEKELGGQGCVGLDAPEVPGHITGGVLLCNAASCRYDTANCFYCGDGYLNGNETCEDGFEIETTCQKLGKGLGELSCGSDCQIDTSDCNGCGFNFTFDDDDCPGGWDSDRTTDAAATSSWSCGLPNGHTGGPGFGPSRMWGTNLMGDYAGNESSALVSPSLSLGQCSDQSVMMTVRHWHSFGTGDGGIVQVATSNPDDEASWTTIEPVSGSFYSAVVTASHPPVAGNPAFSALDPLAEQWVDAVFDLSDYGGEDEFYMRFVMGSDASDTSGGWYIDTIEITGTQN